MSIGTRSVLFGAHQFLLHPCFVAWAWWQLFGFPWDPRLWIAFFVHDLGYIGKPNMDGPEGERHVEFGANLMRVFGVEWKEFSLYHSRFYAKRDRRPVSRLCYADKLAIVLTPAWLYVPMATATGEIDEYMDLARTRTTAGEPKYASMNTYSNERRQWYANVQEYLRRWVAEHKDGRSDTWTPEAEARHE